MEAVIKPTENVSKRNLSISQIKNCRFSFFFFFSDIMNDKFDHAAPHFKFYSENCADTSFPLVVREAMNSSWSANQGDSASSSDETSSANGDSLFSMFSGPDLVAAVKQRR